MKTTPGLHPENGPKSDHGYLYSTADESSRLKVFGHEEVHIARIQVRWP